MAAEKSRPAVRRSSAKRQAAPAGTPTPAQQTVADAMDRKPKDMPKSAPVAEAGPVEVHVESGEVKVVVAPLDEANIGRFTELVREMSVQTQFVLIAHSKKTMSIAPVLYGVTMQEPGVSKLVSVRFGATA